METGTFVGLRNYLHMFSDADTGNAYLFTFKFAVIATILVNVISLILACALNAKIKFKTRQSFLLSSIYAWKPDR